MASVLGLDIIGKTEKGRQQLTLVCIVVFFLLLLLFFVLKQFLVFYMVRVSISLLLSCSRNQISLERELYYKL